VGTERLQKKAGATMEELVDVIKRNLKDNGFDLGRSRETGK